MSENTIRCPNCGYAMQNLYIQSKNNHGRRTWKSVDAKYCQSCNIETPGNEIKIH